MELSIGASLSHSETYTILIDVRQRLALARRFLRLFRFLDAFNSAQKLYSTISTTSISSKGRPLWVHSEAYIDVLGRTFNGMYLLLEASTIVDAMQVDRLRVWTPEWERIITVEAQRFWLFALVCGLTSGLLKIMQVLAYTPVPAAGDVTQSQKTAERHHSNHGGGQNEKIATEEFDVKKEQQRLRGLVQDQRKKRALWRRDVRAKIHGLSRVVIANALDIVLPGSVVGWVKVDQGTVGLAMFVTTILTAIDAWNRCGHEVGVVAASAR